MARRNSYRGKYKMSKAQFLSAKYYALRYNEWVLEYKSLLDTSQAITYSDMHSGSMNTNSAVEDAAIKAEAIHDKIRLIEQTAHDASPELAQYVLKAVTNYDVTFHMLKTLTDIPCGKDMFNNARRRFYYMLYQKI